MRNYLLLVVILCTILSCNHNQNDNKETQNLVADSSLTQINKTNEVKDKKELANRFFFKRWI